jgi:DNA-binding transcriptional MocR family regulator
VNEVRKISAAVHGEIPYDSPQIIMSCGSTDSISKSMMMLLDPDEFLLTEEYAFGTAIGTMEPWGVQAVPIKMDDMGMLPGALREALENWDDQRGRRPHVLYTITMGQNPTGGVLSLDHRKEIYKICQDFDICIVEDDPYWYLQFDRPLSDSRKTKDGKYPFLQSMTPSYLKIDTDGRVIRLDTFSKTVAPGCRCGWITAQPLFIERMTRHAENTTQQPSGFVQSMLASLLKTWTLDGWVAWLEGLRDQYEHRRNVMCDALAQGIEGGAVLIREVDSFEGDYLHVSAPTTLCTFVKPAGGMFVWLRVHIEQHPRFKVEDKAKLMEELWIKVRARSCCISC